MKEARRFRWDRLILICCWVIGVPLALWVLYALGAYVPPDAGISRSSMPIEAFRIIGLMVVGLIKVGLVVLAAVILGFLVYGAIALYQWLWSTEK